jgi:hypothetical protein
VVVAASGRGSDEGGYVIGTGATTLGRGMNRVG